MEYSMWHDTSLVSRLGLRYPIVQGPFGGFSSPRLVAAVSNCGGLGSYGALGLTAEQITDTIKNIRGLTSSPFAVNLWISTDDPGARDLDRAAFDAALQPLIPFYAELGVTPPTYPPAPWVTFDQQIGALLDARPPVFSFIFGIPPAEIFQACRDRGIAMMGTATTVDEAMAIEAAGADVIVASGFEAGGHRSSFLRSAESSLMGTFSLIPQVADAVRVPVVAAGGVADGRGIAAALTLGADGVQIGTAFLACDESDAAPAHKEALLHAHQTPTILTRGYTGRLARGLTNRLGETMEPLARAGRFLPYPLQGQLIRELRAAAAKQGRTDLMPMWAGQSAPLLTHRKAAELFEDLVQETEHVLSERRGESTPLAL
jgi:nitronate monooxygenase